MCFLDKSTWGFSRNTKKQLFGVPCEHPLPLPLGEVAERSEDGEEIRLQYPLSHLR